MKLGYLQFLELEAFTRFGTKLEAGAEAAIARGRVLREILRQDRLSPLPPEFQLAWMTAFNAGLLDGTSPAEVPQLLARLHQELKSQALTLDTAREDWFAHLKGWLATADARPEAAPPHAQASANAPPGARA
jgi:F-type H+-transporting ATPase subunit alpha